MLYDMTFDGQQLKWNGQGTFQATTGLRDSQLPQYQCRKDSGPIPEGVYRVLIGDKGTAHDDGTGHCQLAPGWGLQTIPRGAAAGDCERYWANWGLNRARLEPANVETLHACTPQRGGFYLHDSTKGYSHGCIEVEVSLFPLLRRYARTSGRGYLLLQVKYVANRITYGGTRR